MRTRFFSPLLRTLLPPCLLLAACADGAAVSSGARKAQPGSGLFKVELSLEEDMQVADVKFAITGPEIDRLTGVLRVEADEPLVRAELRLPAGEGYTVRISTMDLETRAPCATTTSFRIGTDETTQVDLRLQCEDTSDGDLLDSDAGTDDRVEFDAARPVDPMDDASPSQEGASSKHPGVATLQPPWATPANDGDAAKPPVLEPTPPVQPPMPPVQEPVPVPPVQEPAPPVQEPAPPVVVEVPDETGLSACEICSRRNCADTRGINRLRDCYMQVGEAAAGPKAGTPKATLCTNLMNCAHATSCVSPEPEECYCGEDVTRETCRAKKPLGVCKQQYEAAGETTDATMLTMGFGQTNTVLGAATRILACEAELCGALCFPSAQL